MAGAIAAAAAFIGALLAAVPAWAADPAFEKFLQSQWPAAQKLGVSRATFDTAIKGLEPDLSLPDLVIPGRPPQAQKGQAEFVQLPVEYLKESTLDRLAAQGRKLSQEHRATLQGIERDYGVPGPVILAIWGRETAFGGYKLPHDTLRVLATQAFTGRRKDMFASQFLYALKMLQDGIPREKMRSSWGGAMGLTQFLPAEFYEHGVDFDRDGKVDIWTSVPDALASAAKQLVNKGWARGVEWAVEVRAPKSVDCTIGVPEHVRPIRDWQRAGFAPAYDRKLRAETLAEPASLLQPAGLYGPSFLTTKNYFVIKEYNFSDLYVLFVGSLADRIANGPSFETPWAKVVLLKTTDVEKMQDRLTALQLYSDKLDGKAGMKTRAALGAYQKANGLAVDCWPTVDVLNHMRARR
ncbi:MAG TPA: lytic murein transglycosylase [Xanthobacteraceae bacterium]|nr:lytic murein transglycosylase [Xanthobacteraceae bacterium]